MQALQGFVHQTVADMRGGRESWRVLGLFGVISLIAAVVHAAVL